MYFLVAVINNEDILDDLITGWLDIGITDATVIETTDSLQLISHNVPIFAGFRSLTSGGMPHNKTIFTASEDREILDQGIAFLEKICSDSGKPDQGICFVVPVEKLIRLGI